MERFSIVIPVYNVEKYLEQCLESVLAQSFGKYEVILVDDGSTDRSGTICDRYAERDARFHVLHQQNAGLSAARNRGAAAARNEYLIFLDSDDWWLDRQFLEKAENRLSKSGSDMLLFCRCRATESGEDIYACEQIHCINGGGYEGPLAAEELLPQLVAENKFECAAWIRILRRVCFVTFCEDLRAAEDIEWIVRQCKVIQTVDVLNEPIYAYRIRKGSLSRTKSTGGWTLRANIIRQMLQTLATDGWNSAVHDALMGFCAFQYSLLVMDIACIPTRQERRTAVENIKDLTFLVDFAKGKKEKIVCRMVKQTGVETASRISRWAWTAWSVWRDRPALHNRH